jgi:hypothetical protein
VRDGDERLAALAQREPVQVDGAVLGDDPVHVAARGDDARAGLERRVVMRETLPPAAVEGSAMIGLPPSERAAPRMKSICPPMPE